MSEWHDTCPICNALITYDWSGLPVVCPFCQNPLSSGTTDPSFHHLGEIDRDVEGGGIGEICTRIIPPGTKICVQCTQIYPKQFECCPKLIDLALAAFGHPTSEWSPKTRDRIVDFLKGNPVVVENTIRLRLLQAMGCKLDEEVAGQIAFCVKTIGLPVGQSQTLRDWEEWVALDSEAESDSDPDPDSAGDFGTL
jgi:hypothetical protein